MNDKLLYVILEHYQNDVTYQIKRQLFTIRLCSNEQKYQFILINMQENIIVYILIMADKLKYDFVLKYKC